MTRTEIFKAFFKPLDRSRVQVKTRVLDGHEFSKNKPPWVFALLRFRKNYYICTFKISGIICSVKLYESKHTMKIMYVLKFPCLLQRENFLSSLSLVELELEPTLTWVLSEPKFGFYLGFKAFTINLSYE